MLRPLPNIPNILSQSMESESIPHIPSSGSSGSEYELTEPSEVDAETEESNIIDGDETDEDADSISVQHTNEKDGDATTRIVEIPAKGVETEQEKIARNSPSRVVSSSVADSSFVLDNLSEEEYIAAGLA